jgi:hypothetical protein
MMSQQRNWGSWTVSYKQWHLATCVLAVGIGMVVAGTAPLAQSDEAPGGEALATQIGTVGPALSAAPEAAPLALSPTHRARLEAHERRLLSGPPLSRDAEVDAAEPPVDSATTIEEASQVPGDFLLFESTTPSSVIPSGFRSNVNEPSVGMSGRVRFMTGNWYAAFSNDAGNTWTHVSPFTNFPTADGGFCCDQVALYEPSRDMMFWLLQYVKSTNDSAGINRLRLAVFRDTTNGIGAGGWLFYDFVPSMVGGPTSGEWFDYPHLALSNNFIYVTVNVFSTTTDTWTRTVIMRLPLDPILAGAGFGFNFLSWNQNFNFTPIQGAKDVMYWASHQTTSSMRVFGWPENTVTINLFDRPVAPWTATARGSSSCPTSDGQDWCLRTDHRILGGALSWNHLTRQAELWFLWNVRQGGGFPMPYVEAVRYRESDLANVGRPFVWNPTGTFHYPAAARNVRGDIGLSLSFAGGTDPPSHAVCIADDFVPVPPGWSCIGVRAGTSGPAGNAWGDYVAVRPAHPDGNAWHATGFTLQGGKLGDNVEPRSVVFGRERDENGYLRWMEQ